MGKRVIACDASNRHLDEMTGYLRVSDCILTAESVDPYYGHEISTSADLDLEPTQVYYVYRPKEELEKALKSFEGLPLLDRHDFDKIEDIKDEVVGSVMNDLEVKANGDVVGSIIVTESASINQILDKSKMDLSAGYDYVPVLESGEWNGIKYDLKMTDIHGIHVAIVKDGRVPRARVADEKLEREAERMEEFLKALKDLLDQFMDRDNEKREETAEELGIDEDRDRKRAEDRKAKDRDREWAKDRKARDRDTRDARACDDELGEIGRELYAVLDEIDDNELADKIKAILKKARGAEAEDTEADGDDFIPAADEDDEEILEERREKILAGDRAPRRRVHAFDERAVAARAAARAKDEAMASYRQIHDAAKECRSIIGDASPFDFNSADEIYKLALETKGINAARHPRQGWKSMVQMLALESDRSLAADWNVKDGVDVKTLPEDLQKVRRVGK